MVILIADDDPVNLKLLQRALEQLGHECVATADGRAALAACDERRFDVVISDWEMPGVDGPELCRRLRGGSDGYHYTYFVLLTALSERANLIEGMQAGADDYLTKPLDRDLLRARLWAAQRITELHRRLGEQAQLLRRLNQELFESGRVDSLTGVGNRLRMGEDLHAEISLAVRHSRPLCIGLADVDHFKAYNDSVGHQAGDDVLRRVAAALAETCRTSDSVYRYGGEEFLILFRETAIDGAMVATERLRAAVQALRIAHPGRHDGLGVTMSAGVAQLGETGDLPSLLAAADGALYAAKHAGRNLVQAAEPLPV